MEELNKEKLLFVLFYGYCNSIKVKVKVKFSIKKATKAHRGSRGIALLFL